MSLKYLCSVIYQVVRHYHGHLSGVHAISVHPTIDILVTGGRDASARVSGDRLLVLASECIQVSFIFLFNISIQ